MKLGYLGWEEKDTSSDADMWRFGEEGWRGYKVLEKSMEGRLEDGKMGDGVRGPIGARRAGRCDWLVTRWCH